MEKTIKPASGYLFLLLGLATLGLGIYMFTRSAIDASGKPSEDINAAGFWIGALLFILAILFFAGLTIIFPNQARVCSLFGKYKGTIRSNGLLWVNPFYKKQLISLRANNFEST